MKIIIFFSLLLVLVLPDSSARAANCFSSRSFCTRISAPYTCLTSVTIPARKRLCPRDTRRGDREFSGNGPKVTARAWLSIHSSNRLAYNLSLHAIETKKDWTEAKGNWHQTVCSVPAGYKITRVVNRSKSDASYTDTNHKLDFPRIKNGTLVRRFEINGDTKGKDIGNCTTDDVYMNVYFNSPTIEIRRLEKIISRLDVFRDYPSRQVNKLGQKIRSFSHDDNHWYVGQQDTIWKIPVSLDLNSIGNVPPEQTLTADIPPLLKRQGYRNFGDLDVYQGRVYVVVTGEGRVKKRPVIAVFNHSDMNLVQIIPFYKQQSSVTFIAIDPVRGTLYTAPDSTTASLTRYKINANNDQLVLSPLSAYSLRQKSGRSLSLTAVRSGSFSKDGRYMFLITGNDNRLLSFNFRTQRIMLSSALPSGMVAQGVSYWNLGNKAPGIAGQVHLIMSSTNPEQGDAYSMKHFFIREIYDPNTS